MAVRVAIGIALFAALLVANEFITRVALPAFDPGNHVRFVDPDGDGPMPVLGAPNAVQRQIKNTGDYDVIVRFNRHGFRDDQDVSTAMPPDVLLAGDSYTFGWGVDESKRLSEVAASQSGRRVFNVAVTGDVPDYQSQILYARSLGARAGLAVVGISMESDVHAGPREVEAAPKASPPAGGTLLGIKVWLTQHSALYFAATSLVHHVPTLRWAAIRLGLLVPNLEGVHRVDAGTDAVSATANRLASFEAPVPVLFVLIPSRALWVGGDTARAWKTHTALVNALKARGLDLIDLAPAFERGGGLKNFFVNDGHWNAAGHAIAGREIAAWLKER